MGGGYLLNKAFTLIELLAVIIILAIIALIATPIILDVVEDARISAGKSETQMIYSGINNYCETVKLKKQMGTLTSEDVDCESKTSFTTEEISKMVNLGNAEILENNFDGTVTYLKVKSNGHVLILENGKFVEEGEIAFTPGECFTYEDTTILESFDINYDECVAYMPTLDMPEGMIDSYCNNGFTMKDDIDEGNLDINELKSNNVITNVVEIQGIEITGYDNICGGMDVVMPASINGKDIVGIGSEAFGHNEISYKNNADNILFMGVKLLDSSGLGKKEINSIDLSYANKLTIIGNFAFFGNQLTSVTIPDSVTTIERSAFSNNQLTSVTIPDSVTTIERSAFYGNRLTSVTIPDSVTTIESFAFSSNQLTSVTIPDSVTTIGEEAFFGNQLTSVTIPDSVTTIERRAFSNNQLTSVTIPDSVTMIGNSAFSYNQLTSVTIPSSVTTIDWMAFYKDSTSNPNLTTIINQTGKAFGWGSIINSDSGYNFETGTVVNSAGNVEIVK